eukprot:gene16431-16609_t
MTVKRFMELALYHPLYGYYKSQTVLGKQGDYITAPELTQAFGELLALWMIDLWQRLGRPCFVQVFPEFYQGLSVYLLETSPVLKGIQRNHLKEEFVHWVDELQKIPMGKMTFFFANEFFDALPIEQYVKVQGEFLQSLGLEPWVEKLCIFDWDQALKKLEHLNGQAESPDLWNDQTAAQRILKERESLQVSVNRIQGLEQSLKDSIELIELAEMEDDATVLSEAETSLEQLKTYAARLQLETLLSGEADSNDCFIEINAGAGGTEAQDWAEMLARMYSRWAEAHNYKLEILDENAGEEAGIKSITFKVIGHQAYGWLKTESGVHRLVRISPFDSNARRHTSFASVWVYPVIDDSIQVEVEEKDLRIDTYRASGAGGQHVNKTESAIRITHTPTNIVPYQMVKDNRTGVERGNAAAVLDGDIDCYLEAALAQRIGDEPFWAKYIPNFIRQYIPGLATDKGTTVFGPASYNNVTLPTLEVMGPASLVDVKVNGPVSLQGTTVTGQTMINGPLLLDKKSSLEDVSISANDVTIKDSTVNNITMRSIRFEQEGGQVVMRDTAKVDGLITGGEGINADHKKPAVDPEAQISHDFSNFPVFAFIQSHMQPRIQR